MHNLKFDTKINTKNIYLPFTGFICNYLLPTSGSFVSVSNEFEPAQLFQSGKRKSSVTVPAHQGLFSGEARSKR